MKTYTDGQFTGTYIDWVRKLRGGSAEFDVAFLNGNIEEVTTVEPEDSPPF